VPSTAKFCSQLWARTGVAAITASIISPIFPNIPIAPAKMSAIDRFSPLRQQASGTSFHGRLMLPIAHFIVTLQLPDERDEMWRWA
jgi:hypothetical protein